MSSVGEKMTEDVFSLGMGMDGHGILKKGRNPFKYLYTPTSFNIALPPKNGWKTTSLVERYLFRRYVKLQVGISAIMFIDV